jgi:hypothetical protein
MAMLTFATVIQLHLGFGGGISGGGVSEGCISGGGVRSSSESSIGLIPGGNAVAFGGSTLVFRDSIMAFGGLGGSSSISESLSCSAGSKANFVDLVFSRW